jgi:hypothetical protein
MYMKAWHTYSPKQKILHNLQEIIVPSSQIDDRPHYDNVQMYMYYMVVGPLKYTKAL